MTSGTQAILQRRQAKRLPYRIGSNETSFGLYVERFGRSTSDQKPAPSPNVSTARSTGAYFDHEIWLTQQLTASAGILKAIQLSGSISAATPEPAVITEMRGLILAERIASKLALFLDELARKAEMPIAKTVVSRRVFLSDGKTRIFVRQYISRSPEEVVEYADTSSSEIDDWINSLPLAERCRFDDDIVVDIYWG